MRKNVVISCQRDHHTELKCKSCKACFGIGNYCTAVTFCPQCGVKFDVFAIRLRKDKPDYYQPSVLVKIKVQVVVSLELKGQMRELNCETVYVFDAAGREYFMYYLKNAREQYANVKNATVSYRFSVV